ncbi:beta-N-acetylhexosaminidase [Nonomuraea soli]|uniref:beta-N-acetylhexosaminidase n=1 Tax=Nonomuraea soli TaxID=1032476 RepID=A0A7W0HNF7_9ACTN|nr:family 20 glycosylhydrolase [Nonomuraea soli]MBA2889764.1 hexosaminidase [Nonomuraea soli]
MSPRLALVGLLLAVSLPACAAAPERPSVAPGLALVPQPVSVGRPEGSAVRLDGGSAILIGPGQPEEIQAFAGQLREVTGLPLPVRESGEAAITLDALGPSELGREGYLLKADGRITLRAHTAEGLFRGLQTLRQLLPARPGGQVSVPAVDISDRPRFAYRAVMLDVARRFVPVEQVKRLIDQAAQYKVNVFHWHLTDDQGWRVPVEGYPALTGVGASTQAGWSGGPWFYTAQEIRDVVAYAAARYMTVVPEIDGPGHTAAAMASVPELNCSGRARQPYQGFDVKVSVLCLKNTEAVGRFVSTVFREVSALFPGPYLHIGGDEVPSTTAADYAAYIRTAGAAVTANGKRVIGWHQIGEGPLPPGSVVQYWAPDGEDSDLVAKALAQGAKVVLSPADRAYLDMKYDAGTPYGLRWAGFVPVEKAYAWEPAEMLGLREEQILGVGAPLWSDRAYRDSTSLPTSHEQYPEPSVYLDHMAFPRLPALAEVGWSSADSRDWEGFRSRLSPHAARWEAQGIGFHRSREIEWTG